MGHAFASSDLLNGALLQEVFTGPFRLTLLAEATTLALVLVRRLRDRRHRARLGRFRLPSIRKGGASRWWILPIYVWAFEGHRQTVDVLFTTVGLVHPPFEFYLLLLYQVFLALACLTLVQTLLVAMTGGPAATLGVEGRARLGAVAAILTPTTLILFYLCVVRWFSKAASGAI